MLKTPWGSIRRQSKILKAFDESVFEVLNLFATQAGLLVQNAIDIDTLKKDNSALQGAYKKKVRPPYRRGQTMQNVFQQIERIAPTNVLF